jgi:hypothetical protein
MIKWIWQQGLLKFVLDDRPNLRESQRPPLLETMENVGDNFGMFLLGESWRTSRMFGFIVSSLVFAPMIVDCAALDTKYLADELEWKAWRVFLAQNPICLEALLAQRYCRCKSWILMQAFNDLGAGRHKHNLPECVGLVSYFKK